MRDEHGLDGIGDEMKSYNLSTTVYKSLFVVMSYCHLGYHSTSISFSLQFLSSNFPENGVMVIIIVS